MESHEKIPDAKGQVVQFPDVTLPSADYVSKYRLPYKSPTPGEFPLIGIGNIRTLVDGKYKNHAYFTEEYLNMMNELGINGVQIEIDLEDDEKYYYINIERLQKCISNCEKTGVRQTVRFWANIDPKQQSSETLVEDHNSQTSYDLTEQDAGKLLLKRWQMGIPIVWKPKATNSYQLYDEPCVAIFRWLARAKDQILETDKWQTLSFNNLLPIYANPKGFYGTEDGIYPETGKVMTYDDYLFEYQRIFKPSVWCFDSYLTLAANVAEEYRELGAIPTLLKNYKVIRDKAYGDEHPFWSTTQCAFKPGSFIHGDESYAVLVKDFFGISQDSKHVANMKIETYVSLAFGSQGIMFWQMHTSPANDWLWAPLMNPLTNTAKTKIASLLPTNLPAKRNAITSIYRKVDDTYKDGVLMVPASYNYTKIEKTPIFEQLQTIIASIKKVEGIFLGARNTNVWVNNVVNQKTKKAIDFLPPFADGVTWIKLGTGLTNSPLLISRLINVERSQDIIVVINLETGKSCNFSATLTGNIIVEQTTGKVLGSLIPLNENMGQMTHEDDATLNNNTPLNPNISLDRNYTYQAIIEPGGWRVFTKKLANL